MLASHSTILLSDESFRAILPIPSRRKNSEHERRNLPTILVVDDERLITDTVAEILEGSGFAVTKAYDASDALKIAENSRFDYLLTDVLMPRMNGVELAIAIRNIQPATKILLFSGNVGVSSILEYSREQGQEFEILGKPVHPSVLVQRLREL